MSAEEELLELFRKLSAEGQQRALKFVRSIKLPIPPEQVKDTRGLFAHHYTVPITKEMIDEGRREIEADILRKFDKGQDE